VQLKITGWPSRRNNALKYLPGSDMTRFYVHCKGKGAWKQSPNTSKFRPGRDAAGTLALVTDKTAMTAFFAGTESLCSLDAPIDHDLYSFIVLHTV